MSIVIIDLNEFVHLKEDSVYNYNFYKHKQFGYKILVDCNEEFETLHFYKIEKYGNTFLFSCQCTYDDSNVYEGDLGFFWS